jgi:hypothetical protein
MNTPFHVLVRRPGAALAAAMLTAMVAACAGTQSLATPEALRPSPDLTLAMIVPAEGVQIYQCREGKAPGTYEWSFVAPDAVLFDTRGKRIGHHGAGPYWAAGDGSRIVGTVKARVDAPAPGAIPWLLLATRTEGGDGAFSGVAMIQRVNTAGGVAPAEPCGPESVGKPARVAYSADYHLYRAR